MRNRNSPLAPIAALLVTMLSIQSGASLAKHLFPLLGALGTTSIRLALAAAIMIVMLRAWRARITRENWRSLIVYGIMLAGMNIMYYLAIARLPLGIASALEFLGPLGVAVALSRKVSDFAWAGLATIGLVLLTPAVGPAQRLDPVGIACALAAAACWALYIIFGKEAGRQHGTQTAALGVTVAALIALPIGAHAAGASLLDLSLLPIAFGMALLSSAIPFSLEMYALRNLPTRSFGILMSMEPAIGALVGLAILRENLAFGQWLAIALIVIASIGTSISARSSAAAA
jgi:inner membrane transporter RhtA